MIDIVYLDDKPRIFYNSCYVGHLQSDWFYISNSKYAENCRKTLKSLFFPELKVYWMNRSYRWNKNIYGETE